MCPAGQVQPWSVKCCSARDELVKMGSLVVQYTDFKQKNALQVATPTQEGSVEA